jgi:serpin B
MNVALFCAATAALFAINEPRPMDTAKPTTALARGNSTFAVELYARLARGDGNRFLSPFSISTALAMCYAGARGETAAEMARTLHFDLPPERLHQAFAHLLADLHSRSTPRHEPQATPDVQLFVANGLWLQSSQTLLAEFQKRIEADYGGGVRSLDFQNATEMARQTINAWVEEQTRGKIKDLLRQGQLSPQTRLLLTNAIYFKGLWAAPFPAARTRPDDFHATASETVRVPFMSLTDAFGYLDQGSFQALELPYKGKTLSMVIFLPRAIDGLPSFERSLDASALDGWIAKLAPRRVNVIIPKFKLSETFELASVLSELGMPTVFQPNGADFSGMTGGRSLAVNAVVHKAFVEVEERGTEAAAATGIAMATRAVVAAPPPVFRADHPFFFLIRDVKSGSILFLGRLARPEA